MKKVLHVLLHQRRIFLLLLLLGINLLGATLIIFASNTQQQSVTITLTENGFIPESITVKKGTLVIFATDRTKQFWPASNLHPTHDIFPAFDPQQPIEPNKTWSFRFDTVGRWEFHDHLFPAFRGEIIVTDNTALSPSKNFTSCKSSDSPSQCWQEQVNSALKSEGLDAAFLLLGTLYDSEPGFAANCHDYAHRLGENAALQYLSKNLVSLSDKSSYCGYGFYHGFMQVLLQKTGDVLKAKQFCEDAGERLITATADAKGACYHGFGHGTIEDSPDPKFIGKPQDLIDQGNTLCERITEDTQLLFRCSSGVYNAYEILATGNKAGLSHDPTDPFAICRTQKDRYKEACYTQLSVAAMLSGDGDFGKIVSFVDTIPEDIYAIPTLIAVIVERPKLDEEFTIPISFCRSLSERFHLPCIKAYGEGFLKYGPPQNEYKKAVEFCSSELLTEPEKKLCYSHVLSLLRIWYTKEKSAMICKAVPEAYRFQNCIY